MRWKVGPWDGLQCDRLTGHGLLPAPSWAAVERMGLQGALADQDEARRARSPETELYRHGPHPVVVLHGRPVSPHLLSPPCGA